MFIYEWENWKIQVSPQADKAFSEVNVEQRSLPPKKEKLREILASQKRFQNIELDKNDEKDLIRGDIQFYELYIRVSQDDQDKCLSFVTGGKLLSVEVSEQEEEIAWLLEEGGLFQHILEHIKLEDDLS